MKNTKVSVIIPVYNVEKYLEYAIYSMVYQTLDDIDIIIVNNCSTDNSSQIIEKYRSQFPNKIKVVNATDFLGAGYARNIGLKYANGEYVYFMDSDDIAKLDLLESLYRVVKTEDVNISTLWGNGIDKCLRIEDSDRSLYIPGSSSNNYKIIDITKSPAYIYDDNLTVWSKLFKRDIIPDNPFIDSKCMEDVPFCCSLELAQKEIALCSEPSGYGYRNRINSTTNSIGKVNPNILDILYSFEYGITFAKQLGLDEQRILQAKDIYKKYLVMWLDKINNWELYDSAKLDVMRKFCIIANSLFGQINKLDFYQRRICSSTLFRLYDDFIDEAGITNKPLQLIKKLGKDISMYSNHY